MKGKGEDRRDRGSRIEYWSCMRVSVVVVGVGVGVAVGMGVVVIE